MLFFGMTLYQLAWYFLLYSMIGWCLEVIYHAVSQGRVVNRGFLNGPVCPVYGFGMIGLLALTETVGAALEASGAGDNVGFLFLFSSGMGLATAVELLAGWALDQIFHARWWDYSKEPFNFHGYICLKFSLLWGLGSVIVIRVVHPLVAHGVPEKVPPSLGWPLCAVFYTAFLTDTAVTVATINGMNRRLKELEEIRTHMRRFSDGMTEVLADSAIRTQNAVAESRVQGALARAELKEASRERREALEEAARKKRAELLGPRVFGTRRFLRAFPDLSHRDYDEALKELRDFLEEHSDRKSA